MQIANVHNYMGADLLTTQTLNFDARQSDRDNNSNFSQLAIVIVFANLSTTPASVCLNILHRIYYVCTYTRSDF